MILINKQNKHLYSQLRVIEVSGVETNYVTDINTAINEANNQQLDLIVINEKQAPYIAKIADFGKLKFERSKQQKEQKKKQQTNTLKEFQLKAVTSMNDIQIKAKKASEHILSGSKIKAVVRLRGREQQTPELGIAVLESFMGFLSNFDIDSPIQSSGRDIYVVLKPSKKETV